MEASPWLLANTPQFQPIYWGSSGPGQDLAADTFALIHGRRQDNDDDEGFDNEFYMPDDTQNNADDREEVDSAMQSNEPEVCFQFHPCSM